MTFFGNTVRKPTASLAAGAALAGHFLCGCGKDASSAPAPLSEDRIPPVISRMFNNSDKQTQDLANQYINDLKSHAYGPAFEEIQQLIHEPSLTQDQRVILAGAQRTTAEKLQQAAAGGDDRATDVLNAHIASK
jgi:hypothetical protein